jgi:iron complex outermembrane receptor protein
MSTTTRHRLGRFKGGCAAALLGLSSAAGAQAPESSEPQDLDDLDALLAEEPTEAAAQPAQSPSAGPAGESTGEPSGQPAATTSAEQPAPAADPELADTLETIPVQPLRPEEEPAPLAEAPRHAQIEEIIVTATKREQSVREIPVSISALTGKALEELGSHKLKDFIQLVPGMNTQDEIAGVPRKLSVRGVAPDVNTNQTVGVVFGDMPLTDPYGSYTIVDPDPWDLATVEVLKGPQGSLFGATSLSGLIRYVPNAPKLGSWEGRVSGDWVSISSGESAPSYSGMLNLPVGESFALRLAGSLQNQPGVLDIDTPGRREDNVDDVDNFAGRAIALWKPLDELSLNLSYMRSQREGDELGYTTNAENKPRNEAPAPSPYKNGFNATTLDARYDFDWAQLVSVTGYQTKFNNNDADTSYILRPLAMLGVRSLHAKRSVETEGFMQEFRLVSNGDGPWTWLGGVYVSDYEANIRSSLYVDLDIVGIPVMERLAPLLRLLGLPVDSGGLRATDTGFRPLIAKENAVFGEVSRSFGSDWTLTVGGRYYQTEVTGTPTSNGQPTDKRSQESKGFSPKVALNWRPSDDLMIYGNISRGFQFGGFNLSNVASVPPSYESSTLWNYEIGLRSDWLDRTLRFDLTAFYLDWTKPQVNQNSSPIDPYIDNVGSARSIGAETTLRYLTPLDGLSLELSGAWIEAVTAEDFDSTQGNVPKGTEMPSSPKLQATATIGYRQEFGPWQTQASLIGTHQGKAFNNINHSAEVGGYELLHFNFGVSRPDLSFMPSVSVGVTNIMDTRALSAALGGTDLEAALIGRPMVYTTPRTLRLNLSFGFN